MILLPFRGQPLVTAVSLRAESGKLQSVEDVIKMALKLNTSYLAGFLGEDELKGISVQAEAAAKVLHEKSGLGNDFLGWLTLPTDYDKEEFARIQAAAAPMRHTTHCRGS